MGIRVLTAAAPLIRENITDRVGYLDIPGALPAVYDLRYSCTYSPLQDGLSRVQRQDPLASRGLRSEICRARAERTLRDVPVAHSGPSPYM